MFALYQTDLSRFADAIQHFPLLFQPRKADSHKGSYGTLGIIGGAAGMSGALVLAATAAIYNGCGKVWAGFNQPNLPLPLIPERPEIMLATANVLQQRSDISAWVLGCGMGTDNTAAELLHRQLNQPADKPLLLDADALNLVARDQTLADACRRHGRLVLTPHPAEAARLLHTDTASVQADRRSAAQSLSENFNAIVVLKGHRSLIAQPGAPLHTNTSGNAGLATAGSGDVLSGIIGSLLAQGIPPYQAVCGGVWLHGAAADVLRNSQIGESGMLAGEIAPAARWLRNRLTAAR
ncbi:MAG: NAD(P)H-hydrate dehydratase [Neisseria sp.]|uniref:NAD(P)H-hydrate dehydratase n=1 Tax=Neisseria sp. TaxID=192066 RepID=UPI0026DBE632|nr:NAD(P)H-hydrate dehydratase [Neisseria sp.]MDO4640179.1 NAD(P)H-hydrate dehydratase [Neisseria sp.]